MHIPKIRKHASGQATIWLGGKDRYLGKYGSKEAQQKFHELIGLHLAGNLNDPIKTPRSEQLTVGQLKGRFVRLRVEPYYLPNRRSSEALNFNLALRWLDPYDDKPASQFGPAQLKAVRTAMMVHGNKRTTINRNIGRIRQMFRWGVSEGIYDAAALLALQSVEGLKAGRSLAQEPKGVCAVALTDFEQTLPFINSAQVRDILRLLLCTAARPGEICQLKTGEINRSEPVWEWKLEHHKTSHHHKSRVILFGPQAQEILQPWLERRKPDEFCFQPADAMIGDWEGSRRPKPRMPYSPDTIRRAVNKACLRAKISSWHPNQLRHTQSTLIRSRYGIEASQVVLGHASANTTLIYAERDLTKAREIIAAIG